MEGAMGLLAKIFGICETDLPKDEGCWEYLNGEVMIDLKKAAELSKPGGAIRMEGKGLPERLLVVHGMDKKFYSFRNKCTHMARRLDPVSGKMTIRCCSIFSSTFDYAGRVISGAAKKPLKTFKVKTDDNKLIIPLI